MKRQWIAPILGVGIGAVLWGIWWVLAVTGLVPVLFVDGTFFTGIVLLVLGKNPLVAFQSFLQGAGFLPKANYGGGSGMPCGACREFLMQLDRRNKDMEILVDYGSRETVTLETLLPNWWGTERYEDNT